MVQRSPLTPDVEPLAAPEQVQESSRPAAVEEAAALQQVVPVAAPGRAERVAPAPQVSRVHRAGGVDAAPGLLPGSTLLRRGLERSAREESLSMEDVVEAALVASIDPVVPSGIRRQALTEVSALAAEDPELVRLLVELQRSLPQRDGPGNPPEPGNRGGKA